MIDQSDKNKGQAQSGAAQSTLSGARIVPVAGHRIDSRELFIGTREVMIDHGTEIYRLRLTKQNKLILTK